MKIIRIAGCDDCPMYEVEKTDGVIVKQTCLNLDAEIHKNIHMAFPQNCPLEDVQGIVKNLGVPK